jgi:trimeric autotransporter adhesin
MNSADLAFGNTADSNICYLLYFPNTHTLSLNADSSTIPAVSGNWTYGTPGVAGAINNGQCSVNLGASAESYPNGSGGTTVNLTAAVTFNAAFAGGQPMAGVLYNNTQVSSGPWTPFGPGVWDVIAPGDAVSSVSVKPPNGSGLTQTFTLQYNDTAGATAISTAWVWFNPAFSASAGNAASSCMAYYARPTNQLYLIADSGAVWLGPVTLGSSSPLSNSQCSINVQTATATAAGNGLTLSLPVTFTSAYTGVQNVFLYAAGSSANSGWDALGEWNVSTAAAVSVNPASGGSSSQTFALNYSIAWEPPTLPRPGCGSRRISVRWRLIPAWSTTRVPRISCTSSTMPGRGGLPRRRQGRR